MPRKTTKTKTTTRQRSKGSGTLFKRGGRGPWIACWYDHDGARKERSTRTTDRAAAERILGKHVADAALRRDGVIDASDDRFAREGRRPIVEHIREYLASCERVGQAEKNIAEKRRHLERLVAETGVKTLADLTPLVPGQRRTTPSSSVKTLADLTPLVLERNMADMKATARDGTDDDGNTRWKEVEPSARLRNFRRQAAVALMNWCQKQGRVRSNVLKTVPTLDERNDRRRVRRALTDDELARLIAVARERDAALNANADFVDRYGQSRRTAWYLAAALAGLRRGDLVRLRWSSVDMANGTIIITDGNARRTDVLPIHPQLAESLGAIRPRRMTPQALAQAKVFPHAVTNRTVAADFERAGIAPDAEGRIADLHALRTTLGTNLARRGVTPQVAQKIMRHADYRTTLACYTVLGLADTAAAVARLPGVGADEGRDASTGTTDGPTLHATDSRNGASVCSGPANHQLFSQQLGRETPRNAAKQRGGEGDGLATGNAPKSPQNAALRDLTRNQTPMERRGLEPRTSSLQSWHSTN